MAFNYFDEIKDSVNKLWNNQTIFWSTILVLALYEMISLLTTAVSTASNIAAGMPGGEAYGTNIPLAIFLEVISFLVGVFVISALFGSFRQLHKGKKVGMNQYFTYGKKHFWEYLKAIILYALLLLPAGVVIGLTAYLIGILGSFTPIILVIMIIIAVLYIFWLSLRLFFMYPAIADGMSATKAIKYSFNYKKISHRNKTFGTLLLSNVIIFLAGSTIILLSIPLILIFIGIPMIIATSLGMNLLLFSLYLFLTKAYYAKGV